MSEKETKHEPSRKRNKPNPNRPKHGPYAEIAIPVSVEFCRAYAKKCHDEGINFYEIPLKAIKDYMNE